MGDSRKSRKQLIEELKILRSQVNEETDIVSNDDGEGEQEQSGGLTRREVLAGWVAPVILTVPLTPRTGGARQQDQGIEFVAFPTALTVNMQNAVVPTTIAFMENAGQVQVELTGAPTYDPTRYPTTPKPTRNPTGQPTTASPTYDPTHSPTTPKPTRNPTGQPTTASPTYDPTHSPTTPKPTFNPTLNPTAQPTTASPTNQPTLIPTGQPTTVSPTNQPTLIPTAQPTTASPTNQPTASPTGSPTQAPTNAPAAVIPVELTDFEVD